MNCFVLLLRVCLGVTYMQFLSDVSKFERQNLEFEISANSRYYTRFHLVRKVQLFPLYAILLC